MYKKGKYSREMLIKAYKYSKRNGENIDPDEKCGCFSCGTAFRGYEIKKWQHNEDGDAALCPYCEDDSVLSENAGFPMTKEFLMEMNEFWFPGFGTYEYWWRMFR